MQANSSTQAETPAATTPPSTILPHPAEAWLRYCVFSSNGLLTKLDPLRTTPDGKLAVPPPWSPSTPKLFNLRQPDHIPDAETRAALAREAPPVKLTHASPNAPNYASTDPEASERLVHLVGHDPFLPLPVSRAELLALHPMEHARRLFKQVFVDERLTPESTLAQRIKVCWRITRELACGLGILSPEEPLSAVVIDSALDPWTQGSFPSRLLRNALVPFRGLNPTPTFDDRAKEFIFKPPLSSKIKRREVQGFDESVYQTAFIHPSKMTRVEVDGVGLVSMPGLPLLPPPIPPAWSSIDGEPLTGYDPDNPLHDPLLALWLQSVYRIIKHFDIESGSKDEPDLGRYGLMGLMEPLTVRHLWPSRTQMMFWESMLVDEISDMLVTTSPIKAKQSLQKKYGLEDFEINSLFVIARANMSKMFEGADEDSNRHLILLRLEEYVRRARESLDMDAEFRGLKQMSLIMGLTATQDDSGMGDFVEAMKQISSKKLTVAPRPEVRRLPGL